MTDIQQQPAIRNPLWIGNRFIIRGPAPIQLSPKRFEAMTPTANLSLRVDRPYWGAGYPNLRNRHDFVLPWKTVQEADLIEYLDIMGSTAQPFDMGLWKHVYDVFDGDNTATTFYLQRRQLHPTVTPGADYPDYPTRATFWSKPFGTVGAIATEKTVEQKSTAAMSGTPAAGEVWIETPGHKTGNLWISTVKCAEPPPAKSDCFVVAYMPLYAVVVVEENPRSYEAGMSEPRAYRLREFG